MISYETQPEQAILVHIEFGKQANNKLSELRELALSAGAKIIGECVTHRETPDPKFSLGAGKVEELKQQILATQPDLIIFNHDLTPSQERNLEKEFNLRVLDRTGLILDIFARRAKTFEGKLQVELAQVQYLASRLRRAWTHLERQRGGRIGMTGPGETQLELDKRLLQTRVKYLKKRLSKVKNTRALSRQSRQKSALPTVSLVGYTNAGKSTLFNQLTGEAIYAANQLFATLDPTLRRCRLSETHSVILADTVGFIRNLPHGLIQAFSATLEETVLADVLLHVIDASDLDKAILIEAVHEVLQELGVLDKPMIQVMNKIDLIAPTDLLTTDTIIAPEPNFTPRIDRDAEGRAVRVWISAHKKLGLDLLAEALSEYLPPKLG